MRNVALFIGLGLGLRVQEFREFGMLFFMIARLNNFDSPRRLHVVHPVFLLETLEGCVRNI